MSPVHGALDRPRAGARGASSVSPALELLTSTSLAASLSAPRAPPAETVHRAILMGHGPGRRREDPSLLPWVQPPSSRRLPHHRDPTSKDENDVQGSGGDRDLQRAANESVLHVRLWDRLLHGSGRRLHWPKHPHLIDSTDQWTRQMFGATLPVPWQHSLRDSGAFRSITDGLAAALVAPSMAVTAPSAVRTFLSLSSNRTMRRIQYGSHPMQCVDLFLPAAPHPQSEVERRTIFFVHGGAWGSGRPWMYRLVAEPFRKQGWAVAILGYRTYPDGIANDQCDDCALAIERLADEFPEWRRGKMTVVGHSSGAHILFLMLVHWAEKDWAANVSSDSSPSWVDSFVGLSGPYDISHHFDYEAARGVEELSPMKPSCGYSRDGFRHHSPALRLQACLSFTPPSVDSTIRNEPSKGIIGFPITLLVHGIDDTTVPFTATAEAAKVLRSCGVVSCKETYVAETGHQDMVMQLMLGGRTQSLVVDWIARLDSLCSPSRDGKHDSNQHLAINSKL